MTVHDIIRDFATLAKLPGFMLNELNVARLRLDGAIDIDFEYDASDHVLHLYAEIVRASADCLNEHELLMEANLFLNRSIGTTIAIQPRTRQFLSCVRLEIAFLSPEAIIVWVEKIATAVESLRIELANLGGPGQHGSVPFYQTMRLANPI